MFFNTILTAQLVAAVVLLISGIYICYQHPSRMQTEMLLIIISTMLMMFGYSMEMTSTNVTSAMTGVFISYLGKPYVMLASGLFIAEYCGYRLPKKYITLLSLFAATFVAAVGTNQYTHLYYSTVEFDRSREFSPLILGHGPYYYVYMVTVIAYMVICLVLSVREFRKNKDPISRKHVLLLLGIVISAVAGYIIFLTGTTKGYDSTMAGCLIGTALLMMLFTKYRLFDVLTLAQEHALDNSSVGLLVLDARGKEVYKNNIMKELLNKTFSFNELSDFKSRKSIIAKDDYVYDIQKRPIEVKGKEYGYMIEISDITDSYNYSTRLEKDVAERTQEVLHIQRSVIAGLANIVEARDGETGDHIKRTRDYVNIMANDMKKCGLYPDILTDEYIEVLYDVAPLHDIGKISISDTILLKPGKLTTEEFETMKTHANQGKLIIHDIMKGIETEDFVNMASDVAEYHHEKWNGSGYPHGISGNDIPLCARIMAVADVYEAVRAKRCYKDPVDKPTAKQIILEGKGTHFDPEVVDAFINCIDEIERI